jgi:hypothetical protein
MLITLLGADFPNTVDGTMAGIASTPAVAEVEWLRNVLLFKVFYFNELLSLNSDAGDYSQKSFGEHRLVRIELLSGNNHIFPA